MTKLNDKRKIKKINKTKPEKNTTLKNDKYIIARSKTN